MARKKLRPVEDLPNSNWMRDQTCYLRGRSFIDGTDEIARQMEDKWGAGRLRLLVNDDLRMRFDSQRAKFHDAINDGELDDVERESLRMRKAWLALNAAAEAAGASKATNHFWETVLPDGTVAVIVKDIGDYPEDMPSGRNVKVFTLYEIGNLIHGFPDILKIKQEFPGAVVSAVRLRSDPLDDMEFSDPIPF